MVPALVISSIVSVVAGFATVRLVLNARAGSDRRPSFESQLIRVLGDAERARKNRRLVFEARERVRRRYASG